MKSEYVIVVVRLQDCYLVLIPSTLGYICLVHAATLPQETNKNGIRVDSCLSSQRIFVFTSENYLKKSPSHTFRQIKYYFSNFKYVTLASDHLGTDVSKIIL